MSFLKLLGLVMVFDICGVWAQNSTSDEPALPSCLECSANFYCNTEGKCECWADKTRKPCSYQRKKQLTAFLLSLFTGVTGADRYYIETWKEAIAKTTFFGIGLTSLGTFLIQALSSRPSSLRIAKCVQQSSCCLGCMYCGLSLVAMASVVPLFWWMIDLIYFADNRIPDGHGIALEPW